MIQFGISFRKNSSFWELGRTLWRYRELILAMARREITDRYTGQMLGTLWAIGHPLFLIGIYLTVFVFVFQIKSGSDRSGDYTLYILSGLIPWMACQDAILRGSTIITSHAPLVKQVAFPIEILPVKTVLACLPNQILCTLFLTIYTLWVHGLPPIIWFLWPFLFGMQIVGLIGLAYLLALGGTFMRDLKDVLTIFCTAGLYCIPIFYKVEQLPIWAQPIIKSNPFTHLLYCYQDIFVVQALEHPWSWAGVMLSTVLLLNFGYRAFRHSKMLFGNVL